MYQPDDASGADHRDEEEAGMAVHELSLAEVNSLIMAGDLQLPSIVALHLGLEVLRSRGLLR